MSFFVVNQDKLVKGAGRIMYAPSSESKPTAIGDIIDTTTYAAQGTWADLGATREGIQITVNNTESGFDVDQVAGLLLTTPDDWECSVTTNLAEVTLENMVIAWEGAAVTTNSTPSPSEKVTGFAGATSYTERRLAVLFKPASSDPQALMAFAFWRAVRAPQEGTLNFQKGGDAMVIPVRFNILADSTQSDPLTAFFAVFEQQG